MDRQILRIAACALGLCALCSCTQTPQKALYESPMRLTLRNAYVPPRYDRSDDDEPDDDDAPRSVRRASASQPPVVTGSGQPEVVAKAVHAATAQHAAAELRPAPSGVAERPAVAGRTSLKLEVPEPPQAAETRQPVRPVGHVRPADESRGHETARRTPSTSARRSTGQDAAGSQSRRAEQGGVRPAVPEPAVPPRFMSGIRQSVRGESSDAATAPASRREPTAPHKQTPRRERPAAEEIAPMPGVVPAAADAPPADAAPPLTLFEIEQLAIERNPSIRQASAVAQKAIGTRQQVGLCPNPTIGYYGQEMGDDGTYGQQGLQVEQVFVRGDKLALNQRVVDQEVQRLLWQVQVQRQRVLTDVRRQFYATLGAQQRMQLTQELEQLAADAADKFRLLFENQQGTRADQLQAEILMNEIAILRQQAANERDANWRQLATLMGSPDQPPAELAGELESAEPGRDWQQSVAHLLSTSPQLQQAYAEAQRAQAAIRRAEVQKIPNVEVQASVVQFAQSDNVGANLTVGLPIPFFNKNQGNVHRAWSEYHRAQNNVHRLKLATQSRLAEAFGEYRDAAIRVGVMQQEILPRQAESVALIEQGYGTQFDFLRLFSAQRGYYEARVQYLQALVALRQSEVLIDGLLLTGGLDEVDDAAIDDELRGAALDGR